MKTNLLLPFLTALVLTGCSNDDAPDNNGGGTANGETSYLAVNIVTPNDVMGRDITSGTSDGGFEYGEGAENSAMKATFILLDNNNKVFQVSKDVDLTLGTSNTGTPGTNVGRISNAVIVVPGSKEKLNVSGVLAILNARNLDIPLQTPLSSITAILDDYATNTDGTFIMSNSVYVDKDENIIIPTAVTQDNFKTTPEVAQAEGNAIDIYVERVVAKIKTIAVNNTTFNEGAKVELYKDNGTTKDLTIDIKGIQIANCAKKSYLFKDINGLTGNGAPWEGWNDVTNKRCYWAAKTYTSNPVASSDFDNKSWYQISGKNNETGADIENGAKRLTADQTFYVQENINQTYKTSVIVTAQLKDADGNPFEFVRIAGLYFTKPDGLAHIANILASRSYKVQKTEKEEPTDFKKECIIWASEPLAEEKPWTGYAKINDDYKNAKFYIYDASYTESTDHLRPIEPTDMNAVLQNQQFRALMWNNGMCYYFAEIEHFGTETSTTGEGATATTTTVKRNGIIRNHIYNITLNSIGGLGVPVIDPKDPIIPERPGDEGSFFYLAAKVNILSWKVVSQGVDLH